MVKTSLFRLAFFWLRTFSLRFFKLFYVIIACSFLLLTNMPRYGCSTVWLSIDLLKDTWVVSSIGFYKRNCYCKYSCIAFGVYIPIHFTWIKYPEDCWVIWYVYWKILRNCETVFPSSCIIFYSHEHYMRLPVSLDAL